MGVHGILQKWKLSIYFSGPAVLISFAEISVGFFFFFFLRQQKWAVGSECAILETGTIGKRLIASSVKI